MSDKSVRSLLAAVLALTLSVVALATGGYSHSAPLRTHTFGAARSSATPGEAVLAEMLERHVNRHATDHEQGKQFAHFSRDTMHYGRNAGAGRADDSGRSRETRPLLAPPPFLAVPRTFGAHISRPAETAVETHIHALLPSPRSPPASATL